MKRKYCFETETWLPEVKRKVFTFFENAENLQTLTPPWLDFTILTPLPIEMGLSTQIDYKLKLYGIPFLWKTEITLWEPPHSFVDRQIKGPYQSWIHTHTFEELNNGTLMTDRVEYSLFGGFLSKVVNIMLVKNNVEKIFAYRKEQILKIFANGRK
jgi:ligand-binding SRPBCC domain-containing protein